MQGKPVFIAQMTYDEAIVSELHKPSNFALDPMPNDPKPLQQKPELLEHEPAIAMSHSTNVSFPPNGQATGHMNGYINGQVDGRIDGPNGHAKPTSTNVHDKFNTTDKVYIVTGGAQGLGFGMAEALSEFGAYDGLTVAAAIQQPTPTIECTAQDISHMISIKYAGGFLTATAIPRATMEHGTPCSVLFVASMSGMITNKGLASLVYNSTKAALIQLAKGVVMEQGGHGIRLDSLCPGHILTFMVQERSDGEPKVERFWSGENMMGRLVKVDEFMGAAILMLSEASSFMTGSSIGFDGSHIAW